MNCTGLERLQVVFSCILIDAPRVLKARWVGFCQAILCYACFAFQGHLVNTGVKCIFISHILGKDDERICGRFRRPEGYVGHVFSCLNHTIAGEHHAFMVLSTRSRTQLKHVSHVCCFQWRTAQTHHYLVVAGLLCWLAECQTKPRERLKLGLALDTNRGIGLR